MDRSSRVVKKLLWKKIRAAVWIKDPDTRIPITILCVEQELNLRTPSRRDPKSRSFDRARISTLSFPLYTNRLSREDGKMGTSCPRAYIRPAVI